jgi:GDP-4-dehydro-6-deoxy-D-mannose reductase
VRAYITGGNGFVGTWLQQHLEACGDEVVAAAPDLEITDHEAVARSVHEARPDALYHLAAFTHVGESWDDPVRAFRVNAEGTLAVLEAARRCEPLPRVLLVGSAEVYGQVPPERIPITEDVPLRPVTPYAASKAAGEMLGLQAFLAHRLPVIRVRAFNHVGPGQSPTFVVSSLARHVAEAERKGRRVVPVGNLTPRRDFTDVRDVVRSYRMLIEGGTAGEVYNVCSGRDVQIEDIARRLLAFSDVELELQVDEELFRPVDVPVVRGDRSRITAAVGWQPEIDLDRTLRETLEFWRAQI